MRVRECSFNKNNPVKYENLLGLIKEVDAAFCKFVPESYEKQKQEAEKSCNHIPETCFTTFTTNVNFQTCCHIDKNDFKDGFGNLIVLERGMYEGDEICFPEYKIGFDVREGSVLFMDVHQLHGNLPIVLKSKDAIRLSVVCYLRPNVIHPKNC